MRRYLVTSALPHFGTVGHLDTVGCSLLPADVYCRYLRARDEEVLFVCASDEHGAAAELRAADAGVDVASHCARLYEGWSGVARSLGLSFDVFGRSSSLRTLEQTQYFLRRLEQEGYIEARSTRQMASPAKERAAVSDGGDLEPRERHHLFLLQSRLAGEVRRWADASSGWSAPAASLCARWLREGVEDWRITRDLSWGIPVEWTGFEEVRHYARFDAPIAYIGATREWADARGEPDAWRRWWRASEDVRYVQFMTREDVPFHTVCFPCTLIGSREAWKLADVVRVFERCDEGGSVLLARGDSDLAAEPEGEVLPADYWRYLLLAGMPEADGDPPALTAVAAKDYLDDAVNGFAERCLRFASEHFGPAIPRGGEAGHEEELLAARLDQAIAAISAQFSALEFRAAVSGLRSAWDLGSEYLARKRPWDSLGTDRDDAALTAAVCLNLISVLARLSAPLLPFTAERLLDALAVPAEERGWPSHFEPGALGPGHRFGELEGFSLPKFPPDQCARPA